MDADRYDALVAETDPRLGTIEMLARFDPLDPGDWESWVLDDRPVTLLEATLMATAPRGCWESAAEIRRACGEELSAEYARFELAAVEAAVRRGERWQAGDPALRARRIGLLVAFDPVDRHDPTSWVVEDRRLTRVERWLVQTATDDEWAVASAIELEVADLLRRHVELMEELTGLVERHVPNRPPGMLFWDAIAQLPSDVRPRALEIADELWPSRGP